MRMQGGCPGRARSAVLVLLLALGAFAAPETRAENLAKQWSAGDDFGWAGDVNLLLGRRYLDSSQWSPAEELNTIGLDVDFTNSAYPVGFAMGLSYSKADESGSVAGEQADVEVKLTEVTLGPRKVWYRFRYFRPFLGLGVNLLHAEADRRVSGVSNSDNSTGVGVWAEAGAYVTLFGPFHLGASVRWSTVKVTLFDDDRDGGGLLAGLSLGIHWAD